MIKDVVDVLTDNVKSGFYISPKNVLVSANEELGLCGFTGD